MGYRRRTGFMAGLTVAQISEFSLIVAALGLNLGHIKEETLGLITLVGVVTIFASTYMILYSEPLYRLFSGTLRVFEKKNPYREASIDVFQSQPVVDVILVGLGNYGSGRAYPCQGGAPSSIDWPIAFREIRLKSGSAFSGHKVHDIPV